MLKKFLPLSAFILAHSSVLVQSIHGKVEGTILKQGLINCYPENTLDEVGQPLLGSPSTVVFDGQKLIFGNDKNPEDSFLSPVFTIDFPNIETDLQKAPFHYLTNPVIKSVFKYESAALTPNGKFVIMAGCFGSTRIDPPFNSPYRANILISFPVNHPEKASVIAPFTIDGTECSYPIRKALEKLLATSKYPDGMPFINIEGLTCIPGNRLLFGIRQIGDSWHDNITTILLVAVSYQIINEKVVVSNDFEILYQLNPYKLLNTPAPLGVSSLEYDKYNDRLLFLTTYEANDTGTNDSIGSFLWSISFDDLLAQQSPELVTTPEGTPLLFPHKLEGVALLDKDTLLLVADDDYIQYHPDKTLYRQMHQAIYFIVKLSNTVN